MKAPFKPVASEPKGRPRRIPVGERVDLAKIPSLMEVTADIWRRA